MHATPWCFGAGLGYRAELHRSIVRHGREIDFLEVVADDFLGASPADLERVSDLRGDRPIVAHGVGMSLGSAAPVSTGYLEAIDRVVRALDCQWLGEHLSFTRVPEREVGDHVPLWLTEEALDVVRRNVRRAKEQLRVPLLLENVTHYYPIPGAEMSEADFLSRAVLDTDSGLLLDVNNLHISALNLSFDPYTFLSQIPLDRVVQVHIAGGQPILGVVVDTHGAQVHEEVWQLLAYVVRHSPVRGVTLEWDRDFPPFSVLRDHLLRARHILRRFGATRRRAA